MSSFILKFQKKITAFLLSKENYCIFMTTTQRYAKLSKSNKLVTYNTPQQYW